MKLASEAEALIMAHTWPGNVRELLHVLQQCVLLEPGAVIDRQRVAQALDVAGVSPAAAEAGTKTAAALRLPRRPPAGLLVDPEGLDLDLWHRAIVESALAHCDDSPVRTAAYLGISRKVLYTLRKRYRLLGPLDGSTGDQG